MSDVTVNLKIDLGGLKNFGQDVLETAAQGISQGSELLRDHAGAGHGKGAHAQRRYQNRSGELSKSIKQIPVIIRKDGAFGGIIAYKEYAEPVEFGTDKSQAYPFVRPAANDPKTQKGIIDRVEKVFKRKYA